MREEIVQNAILLLKHVNCSKKNTLQKVQWVVFLLQVVGKRFHTLHFQEKER